MENKRSKITEENREESRALRSLWSLGKRISQEAFGEKYGLGSQGNVSHYLNGKSALNLKSAAAFANEIGCSVQDFSPRLAKEMARLQIPVMDEDDLARESLSQAAMAFGDKLFEPDPGYIAFDVLDVTAAAGNGCQPADFPEVVKKIHVLESWANANINVELNRIKVITARGTSMQGTIENGDVLFVDATINAYDGDGIYVIARGNDIQVKRLQKLNGDVLAIISDNRAYESERLTGEDADSIVICGRVLAAWTIRKFW